MNHTDGAHKLLSVCLSELRDHHPVCSINVCGDLNTRSDNESIVSLLAQFSQDFSLQKVELGHNTYHHFTNGRKSGSELDGVLYSEDFGDESLVKVYCNLTEPLVDSHHDLIVTTFSRKSISDDSIDSGYYLFEDIVLVNIAIVLIERSGVRLKAGLFTPIILVIFVRVTVLVLAHGGGHLR